MAPDFCSEMDTFTQEWEGWWGWREGFLGTKRCIFLRQAIWFRNFSVIVFCQVISGFSSPEFALFLSEESAVQSRPNAGSVSQHLVPDEWQFLTSFLCSGPVCSGWGTGAPTGRIYGNCSLSKVQKDLFGGGKRWFFEQLFCVKPWCHSVVMATQCLGCCVEPAFRTLAL